MPRDRSGSSGRRFVALAVGGLLIGWGSIYLAFRDWRSRYRERVAFGRREVSAAVDPLAKVVPPGLEAAEWSASVARTHAMLDDLVGANLMDRGGLISLRDDLRRRVSAARPESAEAALIRLWSDMEAKAGPSLAHQERPARIDLAATIEPLRNAPPDGVKASEWDRAISEAESILVSLSERLDDARRSALRRRWAAMIARGSAREVLREVRAAPGALPRDVHRLVPAPPAEFAAVARASTVAAGRGFRWNPAVGAAMIDPDGDEPRRDASGNPIMRRIAYSLSTAILLVGDRWAI